MAGHALHPTSTEPGTNTLTSSPWDFDIYKKVSNLNERVTLENLGHGGAFEYISNLNVNFVKGIKIERCCLLP